MVIPFNDKRVDVVAIYIIGITQVVCIADLFNTVGCNKINFSLTISGGS